MSSYDHICMMLSYANSWILVQNDNTGNMCANDNMPLTRRSADATH